MKKECGINIYFEIMQNLSDLFSSGVLFEGVGPAKPAEQHIGRFVNPIGRHPP